MRIADEKATTMVQPGDLRINGLLVQALEQALQDPAFAAFAETVRGSGFVCNGTGMKAMALHPAVVQGCTMASLFANHLSDSPNSQVLSTAVDPAASQTAAATC